jgi:class 3 adenylate cyclase
MAGDGCRTMPKMLSVEEFIAAGIYDPETQATSGRLELLQWLDTRGFTLAEMVQGASDDVLGAMVDRRLVRGDRLTGDEAASVARIARDSLDKGVRTFGLTRIESSPPGEVGVTADEAQAIGLFDGLGVMFSDEEVASFLRVIGSSLARIGEAGVSLFLADVESKLLVDGSSELVLAQAVEEAIGLIDELAEGLDPLLRRHFLQAIERSRRSTVNHTERFRYRYAVGFVDLVGFTAISGEMDARTLSAFLRDFEGRAHDVVTSAGARVVKLIGDEVMFAANDPAAACIAASELMIGFATEHEHVLPRGGLAYGDVLVRGGDYYGPVVNLASRLVDEAVPQELLVTNELAQATTACQFEPAGRRMVKGFAEPISVQSLRTSAST